jgi:hypothetical protein
MSYRTQPSKAMEMIEAAIERATFGRRTVPFVAINGSPETMRASAIPMFERDQLTGYQFTRGEFTYRILRYGSTLGLRTVGEYCITNVDDGEGLICDFREVKRIVAAIEAASNPAVAFEEYRTNRRLSCQ